MSEHTAIEWCDSTFNPWIGCTKVSPACDDCYAARSTPARAMNIVWGPKEARHRTASSTWAQPERWERKHEAFFAEHGRRRRVFCASLADVFDNEVAPTWRADLFGLIARTPHLDWLLLTKRIGNAKAMIQEAITRLRLGGWKQLPWPWPNVWLGATVINQEEADRDIPKLLATPARVRFLSIEPMLGPIDLTLDGLACRECQWCVGAPADPDTGAVEHCRRCEWTGKSDELGIDWVIADGESGPKARPAHPDWFRSLRDQCAAAGVAFHFKQWGEWLPVGTEPNEAQRLTLQFAMPTARCYSWPDGESLVWAGKKAAGRLLDGVEHNGFPSSAA